MSTETTMTSTTVTTARPVRPFYWSVRRELWENRGLYMAPLVAGGLVLLGFLLSTAQVLHVRTDSVGRARFPDTAWGNMQSGANSGALAMPYDIAAIAILVTGLIVALFYCPGALHSERRDRSVLFWKSLPVSDLTTVLAKAAVPMAVTPVVVAGVVIATQLVMLVINAASLAIHGGDPSRLVTDLPLAMNWAKMIYALIALSLWNAPVYAWLLLVSSWARRSPFLWAILPLMAVGLVEKIAFDTGYFMKLLGNRLTGGLHAAMPDGDIDPVAFLTNPGVWLGLAVAGVFLTGAVWQRRRRDAN